MTTHPSRFFPRLIGFLLISICTGYAEAKPNIIVIFTDDHGYADLSCQGILDDVKTPHVDVLARGGVRMTSGYVTAPQCVPSRAGLLTGKYQNRFGVESNGKPLDGFNDELTIAERLKKVGYATGQIGKWHLGPVPNITDHGFDDVYAKNANRPGWANYTLDGKTAEGGKENSRLYHIDACSVAAQAFIKRHHAMPFFLYVAYRAPHVPLDAPPKYLKRFPGKMPERRRQALAMISAIDDGVGDIMKSLRNYGIEENTLVFYIGDNGAPLKIHKLDAPGGGPGWDGSLNDPLNGEKGMLTEGGIRVPFVVYWKDRIQAGQVYDHPVISLDVAATAAVLAGVRIRQNSGRETKLDGVNLIPYLTGENKAAPHETLYWRWIDQSAAREGRWKYLRGGTREYLFDLDKDREEKHNLMKQNPEVADRLSAKLESWSKELSPPGFETNQMALTWERYFDFYLDGKPAPKPTAVERSSRSNGIQGWVARNSTMEIKDGALQIRPPEKSQKAQGPFIARAQLSLPSSFLASVRLRTSQGGPAGIAWREQGQKTFPPRQVVTFDCAASDDWQQHSVKVSAERKVIHIRLLLPPAGADVLSIDLSTTEKKPLRKWVFK